MEIARHWRKRKIRYSVTGPQQLDRGTVPAQEHQAAMNGNGSRAVVVTAEQTSATAKARMGTVWSWTLLVDAPAGFAEQAPYALALVQMDDGSMLTAQLTDLAEKPSIGMRVEMVTRKLRTDGDEGMIVYGYKFRQPVI